MCIYACACNEVMIGIQRHSCHTSNRYESLQCGKEGGNKMRISSSSVRIVGNQVQSVQSERVREQNLVGGLFSQKTDLVQARSVFSRAIWAKSSGICGFVEVFGTTYEDNGNKPILCCLGTDDSKRIYFFLLKSVESWGVAARCLG